jgi:hypothetical protein
MVVHRHGSKHADRRRLIIPYVEDASNTWLQCSTLTVNVFLKVEGGGMASPAGG